MPFPLFHWSWENHVLIFYFQERRVTRRIRPNQNTYFPISQVWGVIRKQKQPPFPGRQETLQVTRGNRNNPPLQRKTLCVSIRVQWSICRNCQYDRNWRTTFSFDKSEFISCGTAESAWNHFLICSWQHAQASWLVLRFQTQIILTLRNDQLVMYLSGWGQVWDHTHIASEIVGIIFKWCWSQAPFTCSKFFFFFFKILFLYLR